MPLITRLCLAAFTSLLIAVPAAGEAAARYLAVFADGSHLQGETISGWHEHPGEPKLDDTSLANHPRRLRWLRDLRLAAYRPRILGPGYVELLGGDRIPGRVVAYRDGAFDSLKAQWPYFVVDTTLPVHLPGHPERQQLRVLASALKRIVMRPQHGKRFQPSTVFCRDGRELAFRRIQWAESQVRLLLSDSVEELPLDEINEIHLPAQDQWSAYYRELAALSPGLSDELIRMETTDGFLVTCSTTRFGAATISKAESPDDWYHRADPAWSLDPIWLHFPTIRTRWHFQPNEVPLSRITPARVEQRSLLGHGQPWQADRNVRGGTLLAGDRLYGWGFGVHAANELWFPLPAAARAFHSYVGLDRLAGDGGCARAMVYAGDPTGKPLFASPPLIGSSEVHATGELALAEPREDRDTLVLVADAFHRGRPNGADPLDIRDTVDWLEPLVRLDSAAMEAEFNGLGPELIPAWQGWTAEVDGNGSVRYQSLWDPARFPVPTWAVTVGTGTPRLTLSSVRRIAENQHWLLLRLRQLLPEAKRGQMAVLADDTILAEFRVPCCVWAPPIYVPLADPHPREAKLEVAFTPGDANEQIEWLVLGPIDWAEPVRWVPLKPERAEASGGATLTPQPDDSVLVSGTLAEQETYRVTAKTDLERITAVRLEALPDNSLPDGGPGRGPSGAFALTRLRMGTVSPADASLDVEVQFNGPGERFLPPAEEAAEKPLPKWPTDQVWGVFPTAERTDAMMFVLGEPMDVDGRELSFRLEHLGESPRPTLGRFRLWVTADPPPLPPEPKQPD